MSFKKCNVDLFVNISGIQDESFGQFTYNFIRFGDVKSAPIFFRYVGSWQFPYGRKAGITMHKKYFQETAINIFRNILLVDWFQFFP